jgi:hypothetical protein
MNAVPANRDSRPVGVLLGGSGRARMPTRHKRNVPALFKPLPCTVRRIVVAGDRRVAGR